MEPEEQRRLEAHFQGPSDAELRRITTLERDQYRDDASRIAMGELARRNLPVLQPEEYWARFREEWLAEMGFCYQCWATTTSEPLGGGIRQRLIGPLIGTRLKEEGEPCPICHSVLVTKCFCIVVPIVRRGQYRVLFDRRLYGDPPKGPRLREGVQASQAPAQ
jgi:hypothetical protein